MDHSTEIAELKEEMKRHLLEAVEELKAEGKSEEESVYIAIRRFGDTRHLNKDLQEVFEVQKKFAKWIFRVAMLAVTVWFLVTAAYFILSTYNTNIREQAMNDRQLMERIHKELVQTSTITPRIKKELQQLVNENKKRIHHAAIFKTKDFEANTHPVKEARYIYPENAKDFPNGAGHLMMDHPIHGFNGKGELLDKHGNPIDNLWIVEIVEYPYRDLSKYIAPLVPVGFGSFLVYWVLFAIWAIISAYHRKQLTSAWIFAFCLFHVFAYIFYRSMLKKKILSPLTADNRA
nr:permease prefix domain 1-containing protein [Paenactinomyces guangxiensis]